MEYVNFATQVSGLITKLRNEDIDIIYHKLYLNTINKKIIGNEIIFHVIKEHLKYIKEDEMEKNTDIITLYKDFLTLLKKLLKELKVDEHSLLTIMTIRNLLKNGNLSYHNEFSFGKSTCNIYTLPGINVVLGEGCCRHVSAFYHDLFENDYKYPLVFAGRITDYNYHSLTKRMPSNHAINLVSYDNTLYGYDIINNLLFCFIDDYQLKTLYAKKCYMTYKSYWDLFHGTDSISQMSKRLDLYAENIPQNPIKQDVYFDLCDYALNNIEENQNIIKDFNSETRNIKNEIKRKMLLKQK